MKRKVIIQRGEEPDFFMHEFEMEGGPGMVVLDAVHQIQANDAPDLAVRWNCKAGKCGSCSAEVNGVPKLMCMTRMSDYCLLYTSPSPRDATLSRMPSSA